MQITLYSKQNCGLCKSAKEKLLRLGLSFEVKDIEYMTELHDGWRTDGSIEILAAHSLINKKIPMIEIDGEYYDYSGAMRRLKRHE